jgi:hypothetical protein
LIRTDLKLGVVQKEDSLRPESCVARVSAIEATTKTNKKEADACDLHKRADERNNGKKALKSETSNRLANNLSTKTGKMIEWAWPAQTLFC